MAFIVTVCCIWQAARSKAEERAMFAIGAVGIPVGHIASYVGATAVDLAAMAFMAAGLATCAVLRRRPTSNLDRRPEQPPVGI